MKTQDFVTEVISLPVEERAKVVDAIPEKLIDTMWMEKAKTRLSELRSGKIKTIPGIEVFDKIGNRF